MKYKMGGSLEIFETILIFLAVVIVSSFVHTFTQSASGIHSNCFRNAPLLTPVPVEFNFDSNSLW